MKECKILCKGYRVSFEEDEKVQEMDSGNGCPRNVNIGNRDSSQRRRKPKNVHSERQLSADMQTTSVFHTSMWFHLF